jgi:hypothetical protein
MYFAILPQLCVRHIATLLTAAFVCRQFGSFGAYLFAMGPRFWAACPKTQDRATLLRPCVCTCCLHRTLATIHSTNVVSQKHGVCCVPLGNIFKMSFGSASSRPRAHLKRRR